MKDSSPARKLALSGCLLFTVGLVTGIWSALAASGAVPVPIPRLAIATHLNALLGGLWCIAVASTVPFLHYSEKQLKSLACWVIFPSWANWFITLAASI